MPKYEVTLLDGRVLPVLSSNEELAMKQANHHETTRIVIATKRDKVEGLLPPSVAMKVRKVKD